MRLAYFTGGSAGAGHLVRGVAIGRGLARAGYRGEIRMFVPTEPMAGIRAALGMFSTIVCPVDHEEVLNPDRAPQSELASALADYSPDLLIVDLFWAPLLHILPHIQCEAWLIVRSCPPQWLRGTQTTRFEQSQYSRVIGIEPIQHDEIREWIEPIVICNPDEAKSRTEVCAHWGIDEGQRIVAITHAGLRGEFNTLVDDCTSNAIADDDVFVIESDLHKEDAVFPIAAWLPAVDRVHCAAGYNSYWESRWMNYVHKTRVRVIDRKIDDPLDRIMTGKNYTMRSNGADVLAGFIVG